jgi:serine/threonine protein kinase
VAVTENKTAAGEEFEIPDHELIRQIGRGSYGDVWLARSLTGTYRAIKVIFRERFETDRAFSREFEGIERFEPISRSHPNLVQVLHVGREQGSRYYFCITELADDLKHEGPLDPLTYEAKTLSAVAHARDRVPVSECVDIGRRLASALAFLHEKGLVHRDIKPSNILFVGEQPKLGDIGLVARNADASSFVGTEGYVPPEGPGSQQADMFALGKVIYEASTGKDRLDFPALPTDLTTWAEKDAFMRLNEVLLRTCANRPTQRYRHARELADAFADAQAGKQSLPARMCQVKFFVPTVAFILIVSALTAILIIRSAYTSRKSSNQQETRLTNIVAVAIAKPPVTSAEPPQHPTNTLQTATTNAPAIPNANPETSSNSIPTKTIVTEDAPYFLRP